MGRKATAAERDTVARAFHVVFAHTSASDRRRLCEAQDAVEYAGMQLGTSSQAKAGTAKARVIKDIVGQLSDFYVREIAEYLDPRIIKDT